MPLYTEAHAKLNEARAGQPWRPSNGFEGNLFAERVCLGCQNCGPEHMGCDISLLAMCYQKADPEYPAQWQYGPDGQPICTDFKAI